MTKKYMDFPRDDGSVFYLCDVCNKDPFGTKKLEEMEQHIVEAHPNH